MRRGSTRAGAREAQLRALAASLALVSACAVPVSGSGQDLKRSFTDDAGRSVVVPRALPRVVAAGGPAEVMLYTLVPERLAGWNRMPSAQARALIPEDYLPRAEIRDLPDRYDPQHDAAILALEPSAIVDYGSLHEDYVTLADTLQTRLATPYLIFDGTLARMPDAYRALGRLLDASPRAERLALGVARLLTKYRHMLAQESQPPRVYVTMAAGGLPPVYADDSHGELFEWLGAQNVAGRFDPADRGPMEFEDLLRLQPDAIFSLHAGFAETLQSDARWQDLVAVRGGRVYLAPQVPFNWLGRPPSVNRLLGMLWVADRLSEGSPDADRLEDLRWVFAELLHVEIADDALQDLMR